jgi:hypothetical protein
MKIVEIEATNRCNTHCLHCPRQAISRPLGTMSEEVFRTVADKILAEPSFEAVYFSGMGEPTLNRALPQFIAYLAPKLPTMVTTNVSTLTGERIQALVDAGLSGAIVSFGGHTAELYGLMSGGLALADADERIRELVRLGQGKLQVSANVSVTLPNRSYLAEIKSHLGDLGVGQVTFAMCHNRGGFLDDPSICRTPLPPLGEGRCDIFADTLYVAWNGQVLSCCHDLAGQGAVGDLVAEDLGAILDRKGHIEETGVRFPMCRSCNDMYRFGRDDTPDGRPLSEWIYILHASDDEQTTALMEVIRRQEVCIQELQTQVAGYESGRFIRFARWLHQIRRSVLGR